MEITKLDNETLEKTEVTKINKQDLVEELEGLKNREIDLGIEIKRIEDLLIKFK